MQSFARLMSTMMNEVAMTLACVRSSSASGEPGGGGGRRGAPGATTAKWCVAMATDTAPRMSPAHHTTIASRAPMWLRRPAMRLPIAVTTATVRARAPSSSAPSVPSSASTSVGRATVHAARSSAAKPV